NTVGADNAHDAVTRQGEGEILDQAAVAEALGEVLDLHDLVAQPRRGRDLDLLEVQLAVLLSLRSHLLVTLEARLVLRLAGLRAGANPGQLLLQALLQLGILLTRD